MARPGDQGRPTRGERRPTRGLNPQPAQEKVFRQPTPEPGVVSDSQAWTVSYWPALIAISVIVVWFASGLTMLILMGGMQAVPTELYEAADADGAGRWQKERLITLPLLRRPIALSLIISVIGSFLAFNQFYILVQNNGSLETVVEWVYQTAFNQYHLAYGTTMALLLVVVIALVTAAQFLVLRGGDEA